MKRMRWTSWIVVGGLIALFAAGARAQEPAREKQGVKIGVVRLQVCFDKYQRRADLEKDLAKAAEDSKKEIDDLTKKHADMKDALQALEGSIKEKKIREIKELELKIQFAKKWHGIKRRDLYVESMTRLYEDIRTAVDKIGDQEKYDLILKTEESEIDPDEQGNVFDRIVRNPVLYSAKTVDITDAVVKLLNDEYGKKKEQPK